VQLGGRAADRGQKIKLDFDRSQVTVHSRGRRREDVDDIGLDRHIDAPSDNGLSRLGGAYVTPPDLPDEEDKDYDERTSEKATRRAAPSSHRHSLKVMSEDTTQLYEAEGASSRRHKKVRPASDNGQGLSRDERRRSKMAASQDMGTEVEQDFADPARSVSRSHRKSKHRVEPRKSQGEEAGFAGYNDEDGGPYEDEAGREQQNDMEVNEMGGEYAGDEPDEAYQEGYQEGEEGQVRKGHGRHRSSQGGATAEYRRSSRAHR
jgi:hypothetical protein